MYGVRRMGTGLHGDLGHSGEVIESHHVAHHEDLGKARQRTIGIDVDLAAPVERYVSAISQH